MSGVADGMPGRFRRAVDFVVGNGLARNYGDVAERLGVTNSTISMAVTGARVPTWDLVLDFCDAYPVDLRWIRTGEGSLVKVDRETALLKRIEELETMIEQLRE